ncbi:M14 family zinc carboxypeptidase [Rubrivirga marina]|uniref:Peptidase M14 domain-containing protein n=1 Tax=Rubrivirga marina TaxID=1196024 RepID=A0A271J230_9BACT|nr:M14 family zinc carboxypeptidase [Rubrivirga marina]PAP77410.1 hypothetical protein BSZ37_13675 [Rubrivirga marina]
MTLADLDTDDLRFRTSADVFDDLRSACEQNPDLATFETIGESEEGRPIAGVALGYGPRLVTLVAGAHADEPVGPETLRTLVLEGLAARDWGAEGGGLEELWGEVTFRIVPHVNPDGEARNWPWIEAWDVGRPHETLAAFLRGRRRELPGRDVEYGYPAMRPENAAATAFLFGDGPVALHASLHGMGFSEGALLLVERGWLDRPETDALRHGLAEAAGAVGLRLHDHDRDDDKGFDYAGPGFWTTPSGAAMRAHFERSGDPETAARFHNASMDQAAEAGGDPLRIVTELPLFQLAADYEHEPGVPALLHTWRERTPALVEAAAEGADLGPLVDDLGLRCVPLADAVRVHLATLELAIRGVVA